MKILSIRFANLNSLAGEWYIDFTAAEYLASGIFAIVGATGSGKSTILDAISLALYGRTPRLKQISKSSNEIMSRHTGYCFAEVEFASVRGRYRSHWSQHRARRSPSGDLQQPRHEIVDALKDQVLASKIKEVGSTVTQVTGMNFDQFTRSMLLAQGDFSKFLQAGSDDRAPILEQITGTEIYSRISQQVHLQKTEEEACLKKLQQELAAVSPMSASEEEECRKTVQHLAKQAIDLQNMLARNSESINWLKMLQQLFETVTRQNLAFEDAKRKWLEANPQREKLRQGEAAQVFVPRYNQLTQLKALQQEELGTADATAKERDAATQRLQEARDRLTGCKDHLARVTEKKITSDKVISEVVQLDLLSEQQQKTLTELQRAIEDDDKKLATLLTEGSQLTAKLSDSRQKQHKLDKYFKRHVHEAELVESFAGIKERISAYSHLMQKAESLTEQLHKLCVALQAAKTSTTEKSEGMDKAAALVTRHKKTIENLNSKLSGVTDQDITRLYRLSQQQAKRVATVTEAIKCVARLDECRTVKKQLEQEITESVKRISTVQKECVCENEKFKLLYDNVSKQEEIVIFATRIEAYEKERLKLQDGNPCPLCGSTVHPFRDTGDIIPDQARQQLREERKRLEKCDEQRKKLQTELGILDHTLRLSHKNQHNNEERHRLFAEELRVLYTRLQLGEEPPISLLLKMAATTERDHQKSLELIRNTEKITQAVKRCGHKLEEALHVHNKAEKSLQQAKFDLQKTNEKITELTEQRTILQQEQKIAHRLLSKHIACYNIDPLTASNLNTVLNQLERKRDQWKKNVAARQELEASRQTLLDNQNRIQLSLTHVTSEQNKKEERLKPLAKELSILKDKRATLLGDRDPKQAARLIQTELELAEKNVQDCRAVITQHERTASTLAERTSNLTITTNKRAKRINEEENIFTAQLREAGFRSTADFHAALLPADELQKLQSLMDELLQQKSAALALLNSTKSNLRTEQEKQLTTQSLETLETERNEQNGKLSEIQQRLGAEKNRLTHQEQVKREQRNKKEQLLLQQIEFAHWAQLHDLIGSADGKKFRNFAQGLTFELMVVHANRNLARMSERYLLIRHPDHPLELNVIDNYQAGEVRSTTNLSGGESFIISLALALGLASMAGKNIQVNSLFLDEGFGTLDEESLEIALETLSSLQQEGKIIGIISHVPLLKERISVQLQLKANPTGRSRIQGPGVSHPI